MIIFCYIFYFVIFRLENGLEKLRSTASQVDDLKAKLAIQEIELKQKNEAADRLIERVGVETAKVQSEKALGKVTSEFIMTVNNNYDELFL